MKVTIPENISEITLGQFLMYEDLLSKNYDNTNLLRRKINLFTNISFKDTEYLTAKDFTYLNNLIDLALNSEVDFQNRFTLLDIEFGFIPNFDKITFSEYTNLCEYSKEKENLHKLMAVLFRPITNKNGTDYEIIPYDGSEEYAELMKRMPLHIANGAMLFFWNLTNELERVTQKYLSKELMREMEPAKCSRISVGIQRIKNWLKTIFFKLKK